MASSTQGERWAGVNEETTVTWDGPLYDRFLQFREIVTTGLGAHGEEALRLFPPLPGQRVLDIGCGFGDSTLRIATAVGSKGEAVGVDCAENFVRAAEKEAKAADVRNASFFTADVHDFHFHIGVLITACVAPRQGVST